MQRDKLKRYASSVNWTRYARPKVGEICAPVFVCGALLTSKRSAREAGAPLPALGR